MAKGREERLVYGPRKYAALNLMLSRWLSGMAKPAVDHVYVTLGGTELRDVHSLYFIDPKLAAQTLSFETRPERYKLASVAVGSLSSLGINVSLSQTNIFDYRRTSDKPHIFFIDLEGICAWEAYDIRFGKMFQNETIREQDCLLITSHLGHNPGLGAIQQAFSGEFSVLGIDEEDDVKRMFRRAHPSFTLYKALSKFGLTRELKLACLGCVKYRDTTPMGIFGYGVYPGTTDLKGFVQDSQIRYFNMNDVELCATDAF